MTAVDTASGMAQQFCLRPYQIKCGAAFRRSYTAEWVARRAADLRKAGP